MKKWMHGLTLMDRALLCLILTLGFFIYFNFEYLPLYNMLMTNSDVLNVEDVARNLNAGGHLYEWRLTQAPYLFPDIFMARILTFFSHEPGQIGIYYTVVFGVFILGLVIWICKLANTQPFIPAMTAMLLYLFTYHGMLSGDVISLYFGLIGHHSGIIIPILLFIAGVFLPSIGLVFISIFLGTISDSLMILATLPLLSVFLLFAWSKKEITSNKAFKIFSVTLFAIILAHAFGYLTPYPQGREFLRNIFIDFPRMDFYLNQKIP